MGEIVLLIYCVVLGRGIFFFCEGWGQELWNFRVSLLCVKFKGFQFFYDVVDFRVFGYSSLGFKVS